MNKKQKIAIGINFFTAITQLVVSSILIIRRGFAAFGYYTMDSNIFAAITSIFLIISLLTKKEVSERIHNFRYYSTCCVTLTFLVVITILVPMDGWHTLPNRLFMGSDFWLHTVGPLLNIVSFIFFAVAMFHRPRKEGAHSFQGVVIRSVGKSFVIDVIHVANSVVTQEITCYLSGTVASFNPFVEKISH